MAKTTSPLFAIEASGQLGKTIVYDRRGFVRVYTVPTNPRTDGQANVRTPFRAIAAVVKAIGKHATEDIRGVAEPSYRWNAWILTHTLGKGLANWNAAMAAFDSLDATAQDNWNADAQAAGINPQPMPYDENPPDRLPGRAMFAVARVLHQAGLGPGDPVSEATSSEWKNYLTS